VKIQRYPRMARVSSDAWLNELPSHWDFRPVRRLGVLKSGTGFPPAEQGTTAEELCFYKVNALGQSEGAWYLQSCSDTVSRRTATRLGAFVFPEDTVVFAKVGAALLKGRIRLTPSPACLDNNLMGFMRSQGQLHTPFLKYAFGLLRFDLLANPGAVPSINAGDVGAVSLPVPPHEEQVAIARFLDHETARIDALIAKQERLIELLDEKRVSLISDVATRGLNPTTILKHSGVPWFGKVPEHWKVAGFRHYLSSEVDYRGRTPTKVSEGILLLTARNIRNGRVDYEASQEFIDPGEYEQVMSRGAPEIGDVLFTTEAPLGQVANVDRTDVALAQRIIKVRGVRDVLDNIFLKYLMMSRQFQASLMTYATGSTALGIKAERLSYLRVLVPPMAEQREIVRHLDAALPKIDALVQKARTMIHLLLERRAALISGCVTGQVDVRGWHQTGAY